jgi:hypothetical protein
MELLLLFVAAAAVMVWSMMTCCFGCGVGMLYSPIYRNEWEKTGTAKWHWLGHLRIWRMIRNLLSIKIKFEPRAEEDMKRAESLLISIQPHGFIPVPALALMMDNTTKVFRLFPKIRAMVTSNLFIVPVLREACCVAGCITADGDVLRRRLRAKETTGMCIGGATEMFRSVHGEVNLCMDHQGALRIAFEERTPVMPFFSANVDDCFWCWYPIKCLSEWTRRRFRVGFPCVFLPAFRLPPNLYMHAARTLHPDGYGSIQQFADAYYVSMATLAHRYRTPTQRLFLSCWGRRVEIPVETPSADLARQVREMRAHPRGE